MKSAIAIAVSLASTHVVRADVPHSCAANCGTDSPSSSSSSSSNDAAIAAAIRAEQEKRFQIDMDNAARASAEERTRVVRQGNELGVKAFQDKQWDLAVRYFEGVLRLDPNNSLALSNLNGARQQQAIERARQGEAAQQHQLAKLLANGPIVPPPGKAPAISVGAKLDEHAPVAIPEAPQLLENAWRAAAANASAAVKEHAEDSIDVMTPEGMFLKIQMNTGKFVTETLPKWLSAAAAGDIAPGDPLELRATTMIFNVDTVPSQMAQKLLEVGSAGKVALDAAESKATAMAQQGIARMTNTQGWLDEYKNAKSAIDSWIKPVFGGAK
jgi:hypothetical protein